MAYLIGYFVTLIPLAGLDALWILLVAKEFYAKQIGYLFGPSPVLAPAILFYPLYACTVLFLVVLPAVHEGSWLGALTRGALLGLAAYGAYDLTNHATIGGWPLMMTIADMAWGTFVTAATSFIAFFLIGFFS